MPSSKATNPGPVGKRGGRRPNAGRPSLAQMELVRLAEMEGKTQSQVIAEVHAGYVSSMRILNTALPRILANLIKRATDLNDADIQKFLVSLYFKHAGGPPPALPSPNTPNKLAENLTIVLQEAQRRDILLNPDIPVVEGSVSEVPFAPAKSFPMGDSERPQPH